MHAIKAMDKNVKDLLTLAIKSKDNDNLRFYRNQRRVLNNNIYEAKRVHLSEAVSHPKYGWKEVKNINGVNKQSTVQLRPFTGTD